MNIVIGLVRDHGDGIRSPADAPQGSQFFINHEGERFFFNTQQEATDWCEVRDHTFVIYGD